MQQISKNLHTNHRKPLIYFGVFFIIAFISYGTGATLIDNITSGQKILSTVANDNFSVVFGGILMALIHTFANIALPVLLLPILKPLNQRFAYAYFAFCIVATTILVFGVIFLMMLIPLADVYINQDTIDSLYFDAFTTILVKAGKYGYHMGMALWSVGGMFLCAIIHQSKLLPRFMSVWGAIGYLTLLIGSISELFSHNATLEIISVIPGGIFEVTLAIWLIVKGFTNPTNQKNSPQTALVQTL